MKKIVFATNNAHKLAEVRAILQGRFEILSLADIGCSDDIPETGDTFRDNAMQKAKWVRERYGYDCFADDSGLEVDALGGAPGVLSARYSGVAHDDKANNSLLLENLKGKSDRSAAFTTVIALLFEGGEYFFTGCVKGEILEQPCGDAGFGYDPLFRPCGWTKTFAQAAPGEKNAVSHRGQAVRKLIEFLSDVIKN